MNRIYKFLEFITCNPFSYIVLSVSLIFGSLYWYIFNKHLWISILCFIMLIIQYVITYIKPNYYGKMIRRELQHILKYGKK